MVNYVESKDQRALESQVESRAKEIHTDAYPMSIGEIMSLYRDGEIDIHPEFQRFFRWSPLQKSKFIESILLGIPIPSLFVSQREDGVWDVVDGVQRLSTIFEFTGILKDEKDKEKPHLRLIGTDYLPLLDDKVWEDKKQPKQSLPNSLRLAFKRAKLDLKIIKKESDQNTKYDLFERLNSLGSHLSDQEMRNCIMVMINRDFFKWFMDLVKHPSFQTTIAISDRALDERYDMELALRFIILTREPEKDIRNIKDIGDYTTKKMRRIASDLDFDRDHVANVFRRTFDILAKVLGPECFQRRDTGRGRGGFLISVFEVMAIGLGSIITANPDWKQDNALIQRVSKDFWNDKTFSKYSGSGTSASSRIPQLIPFARSLFSGK
jgi:hypothetical protein